MLRSMVLGACLCGALRYEVEGPFENLMHCHCSMCRKHHGAPFATFVGAKKSGFRWISGESSVAEFKSSPNGVRRHCSTCFSVAPAVMGETVFMPAGNLDGDLGDAGGMHVFVGSKAPWLTIGDDLPRHDTVPPGWPMPDIDRPEPPVLASGVHGSCLCGGVTFRVEGLPARMMYCHCSRCRRGRSALHGANTFYPAPQFSWISGQELVRNFKLPEAERFTIASCSRCGGGAPVVREGVPFVLVPAGILDQDPGLRPDAHIHVASKPSWHTWNDGVPQFAELPPAT
jgi:hypothetical protein